MMVSGEYEPLCEDDAKPGHPQLYRGFSSLMSFAFCFTVVGIIPSISIGFDSVLEIGGSAEMVWSWIVCSVFITISGLSMAEITSVYPCAGSVYHWAGQLGPARWSPLSAYACGWFSMLGNVAGAAAFAKGVALFVSYCVAMHNPGASLTTGQQVISAATCNACHITTEQHTHSLNINGMKC